MRKEIWNWILKNFGNIFSVFGVVATLYFGIFYIPVYIEESQNIKLHNASKEVVQSIKELIYSDSTVTTKEIISLIKSKEVGANVEFHNWNEWFLLRAEESFMEDKFIPLNKRRELIEEIEILTKQLPIHPNNETEDNQKTNTNSISTLVSILGTLLTLIIGYLSVRANYLTRKSKDEEIENELIEARTEMGATTYSVDYISIENDILSILRNLNYELNTNSLNKTNKAFDFEFWVKNKKYFVELKVLRASRVGLKSIESFLLQLRSRRGVGIFIHNTELTPLSASRLRDFNKLEKLAEAHAIKFSSKEEIKSQIEEIVKKTK